MEKKNNPPRRRFDLGIYIIFALLMIGGFIALRNMMQPAVLTIGLNDIDFYAPAIREAHSIPVGNDNPNHFFIRGTFVEPVTNIRDENSNRMYTHFQITLPSEHHLIQFLENPLLPTDFTFETRIITRNIFLDFLFAMLPFVLIIVVLFIVLRNLGGGNNKAFDFGKSRAQLNRQKTTTFKDVAGCDEEKQELEEIIDFLKNPKKYSKMGVRIPKGILLVGPPGTGKTLLAKAVAGEAMVHFFSISGADFVEMFVGVGASRVRDLFKNAREHAPCIVFIDEIDAVGRQRGAGMGGGHDEREQTLNQLLVEMDGFNNSTGVIIMAATNRSDVLDPALLRPGRFDRQITVHLPDLRGREAILRVHARNKTIDPSVKLEDLAPRIPFFSGADIENLLNEAGILAARFNRETILMEDLDEAIDRVLMGPAKKSKKYTPKERKMVAYHEAGHAVIGIRFENANIVQKITIIPRGRAGGYNLMVPKEETYFQTKKDLLEEITGFLAGRVAEELVFDEISTGAHNDFQRATQIARLMVTEVGMSNLGPIQYEQRDGNVFLGRDYLKEKNFSDQIALEIDKEVREIIMNCYESAKKCITDNRELLDTIAYYLLEIETLTKENIDEIVETGKLAFWDERKKNETPNETR